MSGETHTSSGRRLAGPALVLVSVASALIGQWLFATPPGGLARSWYWFLAAGLSFGAWLLWRERPERWAGLTGWLAGRRSFTVAAAGLLLAAGAAIALAAHDALGDGLYWDVVVLWAASCGVYALAFPWPARVWWRERWRAHRRELALVAGLMALAALLRFVALDRLPNVMNGDEGLHSNFARGVVEGLNRNPFSTFYGSGSLHLFIAALGMKVLGFTALASRLTPALGGVLGVGAMYLLARRLFGAAPAAVTAGVVAVLHTHLQFSRVIGVGYIHAALFAALGVYGLYSGLENRSALRAALGGMVMGFWLYVYIDSRFVPAVLVAWLVVLLLFPRHRAFVWDNRGTLAAFVGGYLVAAGPQLTWGWRHPADFNARFSSDGTFWNNYYTAVFSGTPPWDLIRALLDQVAHAFLSLTRYPVTDFYQSDWPTLDVVSGALFWLGLVYSLTQLRDRRHLLLQVWLWAGTFSVGVLTVPRSSDGYRMLIVFIPVVLMIGVVAEQLARGLAAWFADSPRVVWGALAVVWVVIAGLNIQYYFGQFAATCQYSDRSSRTAFYVGQALATLQRGDQAVMLGNNNLRYGTHASSEYLNPGVAVEVALAPIQQGVTSAAPRLFIIIPERAAELADVQAAFPGGTVQAIQDCGAPALTLYRLP